MTFNTIEDINGTQFDNQGFWWYELDTRVIDPDGTAEFTDVKVDFLTITKEDYEDYWKYTVDVVNNLWTKGFYVLNKNGRTMSVLLDSNSKLIFRVGKNWTPITIILYMGALSYSEVSYMGGHITVDVLNLNYKELSLEQSIPFVIQNTEGRYTTSVIIGYNNIKITMDSLEFDAGYVLVNLLKTDFQFSCNQDLIVGEVNTVSLGTHSDYKPNGDLVGEYATKLSVLYNDKTIPVVWNSALNDYTFDLDLTNIQSEGKIRFKVIVETNDVLNASETDVALDCKFETIDTLAKLTNLFRIGGTGRLSESIQLTNDLTLSKSVNLIGNNKVLLMSQHKIVVPSDLTFKAESIRFQQGVNTIQQEPNSTVELTDCAFTGCTGFGSVIDCQVDLASLDETDDFNTKLTNCNIVDCDMAILSGGNLEVNGCSVIGKISNKNYPYFLYQTDGNATILNSEFSLTDETVYDYDLEFNTCIFTCGETATINGYSHTELQQNNITAFFDTQRNTSKINVQYYYSLIEANVHLQSSKGFCHSVSGIDFIFKSNVTIERGG